MDDNWSNNEFYIKALRKINETVEQKEKESAEAKQLGGRTTHIESQIGRLLDLKANLSQILEKLQNVLTLSIVGDDFEPNMTSVVARIMRD
ncbi:MAG: hypothetical protein H6574_07115 [Lewinellaceae bacterium]|nr:hypothetical protein [Lewinellaceae bacterium]